MKFKLVEDFDRVLEAQSSIEEKYKKASMTALRQFLSSILNHIDGFNISGYDVHHLNGDNSDSSINNIVLLDHNIHSKISGNKNTQLVTQLLLENAIKLNVSAKQDKLTADDIEQICAKITESKELVTK